MQYIGDHGFSNGVVHSNSPCAVHAGQHGLPCNEISSPMQKRGSDPLARTERQNCWLIGKYTPSDPVCRIGDDPMRHRDHITWALLTLGTGPMISFSSSHGYHDGILNAALRQWHRLSAPRIRTANFGRDWKSKQRVISSNVGRCKLHSISLLDVHRRCGKHGRKLGRTMPDCIE